VAFFISVARCRWLFCHSSGRDVLCSDSTKSNGPGLTAFTRVKLNPCCIYCSRLPRTSGPESVVSILVIALHHPPPGNSPSTCGGFGISREVKRSAWELPRNLCAAKGTCASRRVRRGRPLGDDPLGEQRGGRRQGPRPLGFDFGFCLIMIRTGGLRPARRPTFSSSQEKVGKKWLFLFLSPDFSNLLKYPGSRNSPLRLTEKQRPRLTSFSRVKLFPRGICCSGLPDTTCFEPVF